MMSWRLVLALLLSENLAYVSAGTSAEGIAWLDANKAKEGVVTLASGLQYKILRSGAGEQHPTKDAPCECHYEGKLIDGTVFDSSYKRFATSTFAPNQVIKGWTEALQMMVEGDKWELYVPSELGYGDRGSPPKIPGGSVLIFTIEMWKIKGDTVPAATCDPKSLEKCSDKEIQYLKKMQDKEEATPGTMAAELTRLKGMSLTKTKPELAVWHSKRVSLLTTLVSAPTTGDSEEEL